MKEILKATMKAIFPTLLVVTIFLLIAFLAPPIAYVFNMWAGVWK